MECKAGVRFGHKDDFSVVIEAWWNVKTFLVVLTWVGFSVNGIPLVVGVNFRYELCHS